MTLTELEDEFHRVAARNYPLYGYCYTDRQGRTQGGVLGLKPLLELDILHKRYYLRKRDYLFSHTFCLLICQLNANTTK